MKLILTCEHGGNEIPSEYSPLFKGAEKILNSHRGYDPGALDLFKELQEFAAFEKYQTVSRLLVELNRSLHHPQLFSEFTKGISSEDKKKILEEYYFPYRKAGEEKIAEYLKAGENVLHLSIHSFTPQLNGKVRNADVGLLYDPSRTMEKQACRRLKDLLLQEDGALKVRFNYPYLGKADGFTTHLRKRFPENYAGIEIEVNQKYVKQDHLDAHLKRSLSEAISEVIK